MNIPVILLFLTACAIRGAIATLIAIAAEKLLAKHLTAGIRRYMWVAVIVLFVVCLPFFQFLMPVYSSEIINFPDMTGYHVPAETMGAESAMAGNTAKKTVPIVAAPVIVAQPVHHWWSGIAFSTWLLTIWLAGFLMMALRFACGWMLLARRIKKLPAIVDRRIDAIMERCRNEILNSDKLKTQFNLRRKYIKYTLRNVKLKAGDFTDGPMVFGWWKPVIILSRGQIARLDDEQLRFILLHELCHIIQVDIHWNLMAYLILSTQWFNPFCHLAHRKFRSALETFCDNLVLRLTGQAQNVNYGNTVIKMLSLQHSGRTLQGVGIAEDRKELTRRIAMINRFQRQKMAYAIAATVGIAGCLAIIGGWSITAQAKEKNDNGNLAETMISKADSVTANSGQAENITTIPSMTTLNISEQEIKTFLEILPQSNGKTAPDMEALVKKSGLSNITEVCALMTKVSTGFACCILSKNSGDYSPGVKKLAKNVRLTDETRLLLEKYYPEFEKIVQTHAVPQQKTPVASPGPAKALPESPEMTEAIKKALILRFDRINNDLILRSGIENAPVNVAFSVYGKREGGNDQWEAFSEFSRNTGDSTMHCSTGYQFFSGLEGGIYRFKFKYVANQNAAKRRECPLDTYYGGTFETDWMTLEVPAADANPPGLADTSSFRVMSADELVRNDQLFNQEWKSFQIRVDKYQGGKTVFVQTSPFKYNPDKPYAAVIRVVELQSTDAKGKVRKAYNVSCYKLFNNTGFPFYGLDQLFPEPGDYQWQRKLYFFSMSGTDMLTEKLATEYNGNLAVGVGVYNQEKAPALLENLQKKYPFHAVELPTFKITAGGK